MLKKTMISLALTACLLFAVTACDMDQPTEPGPQPSVGNVVINEFLASNDAANQDPDHNDFADWLELYNKGTDPEDIGGWTVSDGSDPWTIPSGTTVPAGGFLVIWCDNLDEVGLGLHANFKLSAGGETISLRDAGGQHRDEYSFGAQTTDVSEGRSPDGADNWTTFAAPTPGVSNGGYVPPAVVVVINEFMASNDATVADPDFSEYGDWIELYNPGTADADIGGWTMTDDLAVPDAWTVPSGTLVPAGGFLMIWADDNAGGSALHASFKLGGGGEQIGLYKADGAVADTLTYDEQTTDVSYGRTPDGSDAWGFLETATPGAANSGVAPVSYGLYINEYLASNDTGAQDPDHSEYADWIEIYNDSAADIDIGGWSMTDDLTDPTQWTVPTGTTVPAGGYLVIWADSLDEVGLAVHAGFKLGGGGEQIGLYDDGSAPVDTLTYGEQTTDVSSGRQPDGSDTWVTFTTPTPGASNN